MKPPLQLRTFTATARAAATGLANIALGWVDAPAVHLRAGDVAPEFRLKGSDGRVYGLSDFRGRHAVVLAWFPRAFTPGCTTECRSLRANEPVLRGLSARYFAVSVDSADTNEEFARSLDLPFPILSDEAGITARAYGVLSRSGFPFRWTFYIGADGLILDVDRQVRVSTTGSDVAARLRGLGIS